MRHSRTLLLILFGLLTGSSIAIFRITHWTGSDATIVNGPWQGHYLTDVGKGRLLTARIAVSMLYALRQDETLYLIARNDDEGRPLSSEHDYVIKGAPLAARYWSITLYGSDYFLQPNKLNRYNYNMASLKYEPDSAFAIHVSMNEKKSNWLPVGREGRFCLALRLYHPEKELYDNIRTVQLPSIQRLD
ncbi:MAG TPA: DUF1214 domain-containing protein [Chitinophagales bacterium]|nr:DUF1214 domain-containing protein [Chitinophagales bacterium]